MVAVRKVCGWSLVWSLALLAAASPRAVGGQPLTEEDLTKLIELQIDDGAIAAKLKKEGIGFAIDEAVIARLKRAGASEVVIVAARAGAADRKAAVANNAITYRDVLRLLLLGLDEKTILKRLERSPTLFTLDASQVEELIGPAPPRGC
jgi:hypothetical protein